MSDDTPEPPEASMTHDRDWDEHTPEEPDWLVDQRAEAARHAADNDDWWHITQREQADREATQITPAAPEPTEDEPEPITPEGKIRAALMRGDAICDVPPPEPLMGEILSKDSVAVLYGRPGGGKSLLALDWALSLSVGNWWNGHELKQGNVLYALAEGVRGTGPRVKAWKQHNRHNIPLPDGFVWLPLAFDLREPSWAGPLAHVAADLTPSLVVIDTLNRYAPGTDEGPADMGKIIYAADLIKRMTGACVLIVHHSGKDATAGARGHSSLLGAVDTELELLSAERILTLQVTKQKDGEDGQKFRLKMVQCAESVVLVPDDGMTDDDDLPGSVQDVLDALAEVAIPGGVPAGVWATACPDIAERTFYRARKKLLDLGLVLNVGTPSRALYTLAELHQPRNESDRDAA